MNKMKKKHVIFVKCMSLFLIAVFALSFAGCSGQKDAKKATAAPTAAVTAKPTAKQTEAPVEVPTKAPAAKTVEISVKENPSIFTVFGTAQLAESDAGVPKKCIKLMQNREDLDNEEFYKSGVSITLNASEACSATVYITLACPDAINGASGYSLLYCLNKEYENPELEADRIDLDMDSLEPLQTLQEFVFDIELDKGENKLYLFQSTANNDGGWRISVTSLKLKLSAGDITLPKEPEREKNVIDFPAEGLVLDTANYDELIGVQAEPTKDEKSQSGQNFGYFDSGASLTYVLNVKKTGKYEISYRIASPEGSGALDIFVDDEEVGSIEITEKTGDFQAWTDHDEKTEIELTEGEHTLKFTSAESGFNISFFTVLPKG